MSKQPPTQRSPKIPPRDSERPDLRGRKQTQDTTLQEQRNLETPGKSGQKLPIKTELQHAT